MKDSNNKPKYDALTVAKYLLSLDPNREYFGKEKITNEITFVITTAGSFRLHQILYLLQIFHYLKYDQFLFKDKLYAWESGVIAYKVYTHFWELYNKVNGTDIENIEDEKTKEFITKCFNYLRTLPDRTLQEFSYSDPAWSSTWTKSPEPEINFTDKKNLYQNYFSHWLQEARL